MLYIRETGRCLRTRFGEHRRSVTSSDANQPVARHFNNGSHCVSDIKIRALARLGPLVRNRRLQEGLVIIVGHQAGREMLEESCVVVSSQSWRERIEQRHEKFRQLNQEFQQRHHADLQSAGVHMANEDLLRSAERNERLPYDTSLFSGASGSPVFDLNGNIVAMHTQGYTLDVEGGQCSLMEFGVQFAAICEDLRRHNLLEKLFPNYNLGNNEERMDI